MKIKSLILAAIVASFSLLCRTALSQGTWSMGVPAPAPRTTAAGGVLDGKFYVIGGIDTIGTTNTVFAYDPTTDSWSARATLPEARNWATAGVINGELYVAGGISTLSPGYKDSLYAYNPIADSWTTKAPMPRANGAMSGGVIGTKFYVVGGDGPNSVPTNVLQVYDSITDTWSVKTPMPTSRTATAAGVIDDKLYVVGGLENCCTSLRTLEVYDPVTDLWATKAPLPEGRNQAVAGVIDGILYVAGGINESGDANVNTLFAYNPNTDTWSTMAPMSIARGAAVAGTIDGRLYVTGGNNGPQYETSLEIFTPHSYSAQVQPPINPDGSSVFNANRGVVPVKFTLTQDGNPTCTLPPATIGVTRTAGGGIGSVNESIYSMSADNGSSFRIDSCQYVYNLNSRALGVGTYGVDIVINGQVVGSGIFQLK